MADKLDELRTPESPRRRVRRTRVQRLGRREYFAVHILQSFLPKIPLDNTTGEFPFGMPAGFKDPEVYECAVRMADLLIDALAKPRRD
jgi:hypothetical protein